MERPVWAEIDLKAIGNNVDEIKSIINPKVRMMAIVKANAYGHGVEEVSKVCLEKGANSFGVAVLTEALELRQLGVSVPVLVMGYTPPEQTELAIKNEITQAVLSYDTALDISKAAARLGKKAVVHIKVDTGMGRVGLTEDKWKEILAVAKLPNLHLEGIFTHFAAADSSDSSYTMTQLNQFNKCLRLLKKQGLEFELIHAANSAGIIQYPESHFNMIRPGLMLYGMYPSEEVNKEKVNLIPAMSFKAKIAQIKKVPPGTSISYGCTFTTDKPSIIATVPVGYADGYSRLLSSKGYVMVKGNSAFVVGRVCMDQMMIDVTDISNISVGDEVLLFGHNKGDLLPVEEVADLMGTINYEMVCKVSCRVPRKYLE